MLNVYIAFACLALSIKILIFWRARNKLQSVGLCLLALLVCYVFLGLSEIAILLNVDRPESGHWPVALYYVFAILASLTLFILAKQTAEYQSRWSEQLLISISLIAIATCLYPGMAIIDVKSIGYSLTRVPGDFYILVVITLLINILGAFSVMLASTFGYKASAAQSNQSMTLLMASLAILIATPVIIGLMHLGIDVNATVIMSGTICLQLWILILSKYSILNVQNETPSASLEPENNVLDTAPLLETPLHAQLAPIEAIPTLTNPFDLDNIERSLIINTLKTYNGNKSQTSKALGYSRPRLYRKMKKLNIGESNEASLG